jgi:glycerophosphoryl diester phosphodiesterase
MRKSNLSEPSLSPWPYPRWIAHRGAGKLAPENTLAAFRLGADHGFRMFECDVKLSRDGRLFLLHDADLARTTSGQGPAADQDWSALAELDAGAWHSPAYVGESLLTLERLAHWLQARGALVNLEIKPSPGRDAETGAAVAREVAKLWPAEAVQPLLSSFQVAALRAAQEAQPQLPRALLIDEARDSWLEDARSLGCVAVVLNHRLWDAETLSQAHAHGFKALTYTVNDAGRAQGLWEAGLDGLITDRVDLFEPQARAEV